MTSNPEFDDYETHEGLVWNGYCWTSPYKVYGRDLETYKAEDIFPWLREKTDEHREDFQRDSESESSQ